MVVAALIALAVLVYTYFGYPVAIAILARIWPARARLGTGTSEAPMVSVLIAVYNAEDYIRHKLDSLLAQDYPGDRIEFLICSDGSTDRSDELLAELAVGDARIRPFRLDRRSGKPSALNHLLGHAKGDVLLMTDIRQRLSANCARDLVRYLTDDSVGAVSGNLVLEGATGGGAYWRYEKWIRGNEARFRSLVGVTGSIYAVRARDLAPLPADIVLDDMWVPMRIRMSRRRIVFAPEVIAYDQAFEDPREFARKVRTLAGNYQIFARMPALLFPVLNPSWFETFSHKLLRLLCPWALVVLLVASTIVSVAPPNELDERTIWLMRGLVGGQTLFYLLAAVGSAAGGLGRLARTFVVLNAAAVAGLWRFCTGSQRVTW